MNGKSRNVVLSEQHQKEMAEEVAPERAEFRETGKTGKEGLDGIRKGDCMETYMETLGCRAKEASRAAAKLTTVEKNRGLEFVAEELCLRKEELLSENEKDMEAAREQGMSEALQDRLRLTQARIEAMAEGLRQIAGLSDPIGEVLSMKNRPNGLRIGKKRVPLGVVGIIYESRPNVTADAFGLCFKTGNAVILRGGSDAINSNKAIVQVIKPDFAKPDYPRI